MGDMPDRYIHNTQGHAVPEGEYGNVSNKSQVCMSCLWVIFFEFVPHKVNGLEFIKDYCFFIK